MLASLSTCISVSWCVFQLLTALPPFTSYFLSDNIHPLQLSIPCCFLTCHGCNNCHHEVTNNTARTSKETFSPAYAVLINWYRYCMPGHLDCKSTPPGLLTPLCLLSSLLCSSRTCNHYGQVCGMWLGIWGGWKNPSVWRKGISESKQRQEGSLSLVLCTLYTHCRSLRLAATEKQWLTQQLCDLELLLLLHQ